MELKVVIIKTNKQKILEGLNSRLEQTEERIWKLGDRALEIFGEI